MKNKIDNWTNIRVKKLLNDIVDHAYPNDPKSRLLKGFYIEIFDDKLKTFHGDYNLETRSIRICNLYRNDTMLVVTAIHELAHHVDYIRRGLTNHDDHFYAVFKVLLYAGLDMRLFSKEKYLQTRRDAKDYNKVVRILERYHGKDSQYKKDIVVVSVQNGYDIRSQLKGNGFSFNGKDKSWEKEIPVVQLGECEALLDKLEAEYQINQYSLPTLNRENRKF